MSAPCHYTIGIKRRKPATTRDGNGYDYPLPSRVVAGFRRFCASLVANYSALLLPHNQPDDLQHRPPAHTIWRILCAPGAKLLVRESVDGSSVIIGQAHNLREAVALAPAVEPPLIRFDPHALLGTLALLWTPRGPEPVHLRPPTADPLPSMNSFFG